VNASHRIWLWLIPLLLLLTWLGARGLDADSFWVDEVRSVYRAGEARYDGPLSIAEIWSRTATVPDQVPGYYTLLAGWGALVGLTEYAGRALSLLLGVLAVAWLYRLGKDLHSPLAGLGAAVALSASAFYVVYLHELRTYTLMVLLTIILLWCYWRLIHNRVDTLTQIGLVLSIAGLIYAHYFSFILIAALGLYHLLFVPKNRFWWRVVILVGLAGVLFLPWLLNSANVLEDRRWRYSADYTAWGLIRSTLESVFSAFSNGNIALLLLLGLFARPLAKRGVRLTWFMLIAGLGIVLSINLILGFPNSLRYLLPLWVPIALLVGFSVTQIARVGVPVPLLLSILLLTGLGGSLNFQSLPTIYRPTKYLPWRTLVDHLAGRGQAGDVLTFLLEIDNWDVDNEAVSAHYLYDSPLEPVLLRSESIMADDEFLRRASEAVSDTRRVWVAYDPQQRPWRTGLYQDQLLEDGFTRCGNLTDTPELYLDLYARPLVDTIDLSLRFGAADPPEAIYLEWLEPLHKITHDTLPIVQGWRLGDAVPRHTYSVALHVLDADENLIAQMDYGLPTEAFGCVATTLDLNDIPPGEYTLYAVVYAWETGAKLPGVDELTGATGERLPLGTFILE
jgi:hypothetical protein